MRKIAKYLAVILALTLIIGTIPVQAATTLSLSRTSKTIFIDGCSGSKANGTKAKFYSFMNVAKIVKNFNSKTMDIKLTSDDKTVCTVSNKKDRIYAKGMGTADVTVKVRDIKTNKLLLSKTIEITVKKNATKDNFKVEGITAGQKVKVGEVLTVKLPVNGDTDKRRVVCSDSRVVITTVNSTKYEVEFTEPGEYVVRAESYQSASYPGATVSNSYKVIVEENEAKPTPVPTSTPVVTPTPVVTATPTPTPAPTQEPVGDVTVKQTSTSGINLIFKTAPSSVKKEDFTIYTMIGNTKIPGYEVKSAELKGSVVSLEGYYDFSNNTKYYVDYGENTYSFTSLDAVKEKVNRIDVANKTVNCNEYVTLDIRYYIDDIDVTSVVADSLAPMTQIVSGTEYALSAGNQIFFNEANKPVTVEITVQTGLTEKTYDPIVKTVRVQLVAQVPVYTGMVYTVTDDDGVYMKAEDAVKKSFKMDDTNAALEVLFKYSDGSVKTLAEEGIDSVDTADGKVAFAMMGAPGGGIMLSANGEGTTSVLLKKGTKVEYTLAVTVTAASKPSSIRVTTSKSSLNLDPGAADSIIIKAEVLDQYNDPMKGQPITIAQKDTTKTQFGVMSFGTFDANGELVVPGSAFVANAGYDPTKTLGTVIADITCGDKKGSISFSIGSSSDVKTWIFNSTVAGNSAKIQNGVKLGDVAPEKVSYGVQGADGNLFVKRANLQFFPSKIPTGALKASDLGLADGAEVFFYTIEKTDKNGRKFLDTLPAQVTATADEITFNSFVAGSRLDAATYTITVYKLKAGKTNSIVNNIGIKTLIVEDSQEKLSFTKQKATSTSMDPVTIARECFKVYLGAKELPSTAIIGADVNTSDSKVYIKNITVTYDNTFYGSYKETIDVNQLISK